jgi:hypothetical protein
VRLWLGHPPEAKRLTLTLRLPGATGQARGQAGLRPVHARSVKVAVRVGRFYQSYLRTCASPGMGELAPNGKTRVRALDEDRKLRTLGTVGTKSEVSETCLLGLVARFCSAGPREVLS